MAKHRFQKGNKYGKGRPRVPEIEELRKALEKAKKEKNCGFLEHLVKRAYENDAVAIAVAKKILPDLAAVQGKLGMEESLQDFIGWLKERNVG
jgi:hypothetical protein